MTVGGGNSTDDPIDYYGELVGANEHGEGKYRSEHTTEKHFEARDLPRLRTCFIPRQIVPESSGLGQREHRFSRFPCQYSAAGTAPQGNNRRATRPFQQGGVCAIDG
jgi:hypothetical protein